MALFLVVYKLLSMRKPGIKLKIVLFINKPLSLLYTRLQIIKSLNQIKPY